MKKILIAIAVLSFAGIAVSSYALWQHYAPLGAAFCNLGETFSCDLVNKSEFSELFGVPVAGIGIAGYIVLGAFAVFALLRPDRAASVLPWMLAASFAGFAFSAYLTYLEFFVIGAICILCIASQAIILGIAGASGVTYRTGRRVSV